MKTLISVVIFAFLAFGQKGIQKLDRSAAAHTWAMVTNLPADTPGITTGGLVVESEINGTGRKVWLTATQPGTYLLQATACDNEQTRAGELVWDGSGSVLLVPIVDTVALSMAMPYFAPVCNVGATRINGGRIERSSTEINPWGSVDKTDVKVGGEGLTSDGRYYVSTNPLPADAVVILGRSILGKVASSPFGTTVTFPTNIYLPPSGPTTLTVCSKGMCSTITYERRLTVAPADGGKG